MKHKRVRRMRLNLFGVRMYDKVWRQRTVVNPSSALEWFMRAFLKNSKKLPRRQRSLTQLANGFSFAFRKSLCDHADDKFTDVDYTIHVECGNDVDAALWVWIALFCVCKWFMNFGTGVFLIWVQFFGMCFGGKLLGLRKLFFGSEFIFYSEFLWAASRHSGNTHKIPIRLIALINL